jgi:Zinc finger, C3HC4 type (RING finger)
MSTQSNNAIVDAMVIRMQDPPASTTYPPVTHVPLVLKTSSVNDLASAKWFMVLNTAAFLAGMAITMVVFAKDFKNQEPVCLTPDPIPVEDPPAKWETDPVTVFILFIHVWLIIIAICVAKCLDDQGNLPTGRNDPPMSTAALSAGLSAVAQLYHCVVCFDVMAPAMTIIPCGHNICRTCARRVRECPTCRERINSTVLAWISNSTVSRLMEIQRSHEDISIFDSDEVETYNNRIMEGDQPVPAELLAPPVRFVPPALPNPAAAQLNLQGRARTMARSQDTTEIEVWLRRNPRLGTASMVAFPYYERTPPIDRDILAEL